MDADALYIMSVINCGAEVETTIFRIPNTPRLRPHAHSDLSSPNNLAFFGSHAFMPSFMSAPFALAPKAMQMRIFGRSLRCDV
jgi:hypothetical protein